MIASVIIPNWNGEHLLKDCLSSIQNQTFKDFETILVDNNSTDGSVDFIKRNFPKVKVLKLDKNYGFAKAINDGVKISLGKYILFLNNDTSVDKDWVKELVYSASRHYEVISINSKMLNFYKKDVFDGIGIVVNEVGHGESIAWGEQDKGQYENEFYIFGATGGASLFRRDLFIKVGMFNEKYFMYFEDVDFAFRAQFLGYKSIYCPKAIVYHKHKASSKKNLSKLEYLQFRNMSQTILRDFPTKILLANFRWLKIILVHFNTIFYQLRNGYFFSAVLAEIWLLGHLPLLIKERIEIQSKRKTPDFYIESFLTKKTLRPKFF